MRAEFDFQGLTVKELSARTGISPRTLEGYLSARGSIPPADIAVTISHALHVSVEYLVTGDSTYNAVNTGKNNSNRFLEEKISIMPFDKKCLVKEFVNLLDSYSVATN